MSRGNNQEQIARQLIEEQSSDFVSEDDLFNSLAIEPAEMIDLWSYDIQPVDITSPEEKNMDSDLTVIPESSSELFVEEPNVSYAARREIISDAQSGTDMYGNIIPRFEVYPYNVEYKQNSDILSTPVFKENVDPTHYAYESVVTPEQRQGQQRLRRRMSILEESKQTEEQQRETVRRDLEQSIRNIEENVRNDPNNPNMSRIMELYEQQVQLYRELFPEQFAEPQPGLR